MYDVCVYVNITAGSTTLCRRQHVVHETAFNRSRLQDAYMLTSPRNYIKNVTAH